MNLNYSDAGAIRIIREYFDEVAYSYVDYRILGVETHESNVFPDFETIHNRLKAAYPLYRLLYTLFRQGHGADEAVLKKVFSPTVFDAFASSGLLVPNALREWRTPGVAIVSTGGLMLAVSLPPHYPTAPTVKQPVYLGADSVWLTRALPPRLQNKIVLDICSGSAIQGLTCALRGAQRVVCLEYAPEAVNVGRFNAELNGLSDVVEVRLSNVLSALEPGESFNFIVSNPPFMPVMEDVAYPICGTGGADGTRLLKAIFTQLRDHLAPGAEGFIICNALGSQRAVNLNADLLDPFCRENQLFTRMYVLNKAELAVYIAATLEPNLEASCPELGPDQRREAITRWKEHLTSQAVPSDFLYELIIRFWSGRQDVGVTQLPAYNPHQTDPLYHRAALAQSRA